MFADLDDNVLGSERKHSLESLKDGVLAIGQKVAEAAKEGGVALGDPEKAVLAEISAALGIST